MPSKLWSCNSCADNNKRLIRYADVLLMAAEAAYGVGNGNLALDLLEQVRARARNSSTPKGSIVGNPDYPTPTIQNVPNLLPTITGISGQALLDTIKHERRVELALEGWRFWDLVRWGEYEAAIRKYVSTDAALGSATGDGVVQNMYNCSYQKGGGQYVPGSGNRPIPVLPIPNTEIPQGVAKPVLSGYHY